MSFNSSFPFSPVSHLNDQCTVLEIGFSVPLLKLTNPMGSTILAVTLRTDLLVGGSEQAYLHNLEKLKKILPM